MTREEAIEVLENGGWWDLLIPVTTIEGRIEDDKLHEALDLALSALRPVSREQVEKVWNGCTYCMNDICSLLNWKYGLDYVLPNYKFCPMCGRPLTDEAVEMVMERMEGMKDGKSD